VKGQADQGKGRPDRRTTQIFVEGKNGERAGDATEQHRREYIEGHARARRGVTVVDVRKRQAYAEGSIPGSVNFDAYEALHAGDERAMEGLKLPEGAQVITVCNRGHSSAVAAEQLRRQGYEAYCLEGGLEAWKGL
jgi:rhodanese-related sulfurtransferase